MFFQLIVLQITGIFSVNQDWQYIYMSHEKTCLRELVTRDQARLKPACSATEARQSLEMSVIETIDIILSKQ